MRFVYNLRSHLVKDTLFEKRLQIPVFPNLICELAHLFFVLTEKPDPEKDTQAALLGLVF